MSVRRSIGAVVVALIACLAGPAAAHEGAGRLALEQSTVMSDSQVRYVVRLVSVSDGHGAPNATVTATLVAADGTRQTPVPLAAVDEDGRYGATITFPAPGSWTVRFTAVKPPAVLEQPTTIAAPVTTTTMTTTTAPPTTTAPGGEDRGAAGNGPLVGAIVAAGAAAAGAGMWAAKRRKTHPNGAIRGQLDS